MHGQADSWCELRLGRATAGEGIGDEQGLAGLRQPSVVAAASASGLLIGKKQARCGDLLQRIEVRRHQLVEA
jgi:hypothetical protein